MTALGRLAALAAATALATTPLLVPAAGDAAAPPLSCRAGVTDSTPRQYTNLAITVHTVPSARVRTVAHYRTTSTAHTGRSNTRGLASIGYYISGATPRFRVYVDVTVTKAGRTGHCRTSFVPHA